MRAEPTIQKLLQRIRQLEAERKRLMRNSRSDDENRLNFYQNEETRRQKYLESVLHNAPDAVVTLDTDNKVIEWNPGAEKVFGFSRAEAQGRELDTLISGPASAEEARRFTHSVLSGVDLPSTETVRYRKDGSKVDVLVAASPIYIDRELAGAVALYTDISDRKTAEAALRQSEEKYRLLVENQTDLVVKVDLDGRFVFVSPSYCTLFDRSEQELIGQKFMPLVHPKDRQATSQMMEKLYQPPHRVLLEQRAMTKDGWRWLSWMHTAILDENRKVMAIIGVGRDITEQKSAETALRQSRELFDSFMKNLPALAFMKDRDGRYIYYNDACVKFFNESIDSRLGKTDAELWPADIASELLKNDRKVIQEGKIVRVVEKLRLQDRIQYNLVVKFPILREHKPHVLAGFAIDITARINAEKEREALEDQLLRAQKLEAIGTLAGGIAHDFNNILSAILGYTELALVSLDNVQQLKDNLAGILRAGSRAKDLVKQILAFSRQSESEMKPVQIKLIVQEVQKLIRASLPSSIDIQTRLESDAAVTADPGQIHQVLMNLCTNAGHAMRSPGGKLEIVLSEVNIRPEAPALHPDLKCGNYQKLSVCDTGHGIAPPHLERIFDPYFTTKEQGEGSGLGLAVVQGIVKNHGGVVTVQSNPGKGTEFCVYLPIVEIPRLPAEQTTPQQIQMGSESILFIDDEMTIVDIAQNMLQRLGYTTVTRSSSVDALELFQNAPYRFDLVITDVTMPNITGDVLARRMRKIRSDIPIIVCSGYSERISEKQAAELGVSCILNKPFLLKDLAASVRAALDAAPGSVPKN